MSPTPDQEFDRLRNGCWFGCGGLLVLTLLLAGLANACSVGEDGPPRYDYGPGKPSHQVDEPVDPCPDDLPLAAEC